MPIFLDHFKLAFRILRKQKLTSWINIFGLGLGLSFFLLLADIISGRGCDSELACGKSLLFGSRAKPPL